MTINTYKSKPALQLYMPALLIMLILIMLFSPLCTNSASAKEVSLRGIWISYGDFESAGLYNQTEEVFTENADAMFNKLRKYGFNNVFFHVRANDDAIYHNSIFEWCKAISSEPLDYDGLSILVQSAHKHSIKFHAWINPYRIDNNHIYNPAKASTTRRIVEGIKEIITSYDVDGIHFDDYFYPAKHIGNKYYSVSISKRKKYVNKMLRTVYKTIKSYNPEITFGISPAGNTSYAESIGCDIETWTQKEGYTDYILPQLYWSDNYRTNGKKTTLFTNTLDEWISFGTGEVPVYIGLALYKAGAATSWDPGWHKTNNLLKQARLSMDYGCDGWVMFSYRYLFTKAGKKEMTTYMKLVK